jgi:REP element-mobilizing transposase RayT
MSSTYADLHCHIVFSTKNRRPLIRDPWRQELHAYLGGIVKRLGAVPTMVGGVEDHVHLLVALKTDHAVANIVRETKKASTEWIRASKGEKEFGWQNGYAVFSVSAEGRSAAVAYIADQEQHHRKVSGIDELKAMLAAAGISFDPNYVE